MYPHEETLHHFASLAITMYIAKTLMKLSKSSLSANERRAYIQATSFQAFKKLNIPRM